MWFLFALLLHSHDGLHPVPTSQTTRFRIAHYPDRFIVVSATVNSEAIQQHHNGFGPIRPNNLVWEGDYCEYPVVEIADTTPDRSQLPASQSSWSRGARSAVSVTHPALDDALDKAVEQARKESSAFVDPRRASIWVIAAPGVRIDTPTIDNGYLTYPPNIGIVRTQDVARVPHPGEAFEVGSFMRNAMWVLVETRTGHEVLLDPGPEDLLFRNVAQFIRMQERFDGVDFFIFTGSRSDAFGFQVAVTVDPKSPRQRFWYGIERVEGQTLMRLRILTNDNVRVEYKRIAREGVEPPGWIEFFKQMSKDSYARWSEIGTKVLEESFYDWLYLIDDVVSAQASTLRDLVVQSGRRFAFAFDQAEQNEQIRLLSAPFVNVEAFNCDDPGQMTAPSNVVTGGDVNDASHPLYAIRDKIVPRGAKRSSLSTVLVASYYGMPEPIAEIITTVVPGFIPLVGDAFDLADIASVVTTGLKDDGTQASSADYLLLGIFALIGSAGAKDSIATLLKGSRRTKNYEMLVKKLADLEYSQVDEMSRMVSSMRLGTELDANDLLRLRSILMGMSDEAIESHVTAIPRLDDLIGHAGFKHPYLERRYRNAADIDIHLDRELNPAQVGRRRKEWLRSMPDDDPIRKLLDNALGQRLSKIEFLNAPELAANPSKNQLDAFEAALGEYMDLFRPSRGIDELIGSGKLARSELDELLELHGPNGLGLEFDYDRFPVESLNQLARERGFRPGMKTGEFRTEVALDIAGEFRTGMPTNWPVWRKVQVRGGEGSGNYVLGLEVPGYRRSASIDASKGSNYADDVAGLDYNPDALTRWRMAGNALYFEQLKRMRNPGRKGNSTLAQKSSFPVSATSSDAEIRKATFKAEHWYKVDNHFDPIGEMPDDLLKLQLRRVHLSPNTSKPNILPALVEFSHDLAPQRVCYDLGMRGLIDDNTIVEITKRRVTAAEFPDWLDKYLTDENFIRAEKIRNGLNTRLGQSSGVHVSAKYRRIHAQEDFHAAFHGVDKRLTTLSDTTFMREMSGVSTDTLEFFAENLGPIKSAPLDPALRWTINQEIRARNLFKDDIPGPDIPRDWRRHTDDELQRLAKDPDSEIHDWGRWQPTPEEADQLQRTEIYARETYVKH